RILVASFILAVAVIPLHTTSNAKVRRQPDLPLPSPRQAGSGVRNVWLVDKTNEFEVYSNGLRVETQLSVSNEPRWYSLINHDAAALSGPRRSQPAGIVFHSTESDQAPFEPNQAPTLIRLGKDLLLYVRKKRAYHYLIDRIGRVHRIVYESDSANHAGHSVW